MHRCWIALALFSIASCGLPLGGSRALVDDAGPSSNESDAGNSTPGNGTDASADSASDASTHDGSVQADASSHVEIRINVNGPDHIGIDYPGFWKGDPGEGGVCGPHAHEASSPVHGTNDPEMFMGEIYGDPVACAVGAGSLPIGKYRVNLYFGEIYFGAGCASGTRIFDIYLEGEVWERNVDLPTLGGCLLSDKDDDVHPVVLRYNDVPINDGMLNIELPASENNGKISAIELLGPN